MMNRRHGILRGSPGRAASVGLLMAAAPCLAGGALAQEAPTLLDTVTIIGTRTESPIQDKPVSVTVVDEAQIERKAPESIAEMLRDVPGVELADSSAAGMKRLRVRGESSGRVTILIDGQEITDHSTFGTPILIDPNNVERIDIVRGPASVLYGAKAIGGVINIITKRGADKPVQAELGGAYYSGSDGWQGWAAVSGTVGDFDYRLSGGLDKHGDRKVPVGQYTATGTLDGTSFSNDDLSAHLGYTFGENKNHRLVFKAEQHRLDTESWTDPATLTGGVTAFNIDLPQRDRRKFGLFYDGRDLGPVLRNAHLDAYYQTVDRLFFNTVETVPVPGRRVNVSSTSDDRIYDIGASGQLDFAFHPDHYTVFGVQYLSDRLDTAKTATTVMTGFGPFPVTRLSSSVDSAAIDTLSAFAQDEWSITDTLKLTAGLRYYRTATKLRHTTDPVRATYKGRNDGRFVTSAGLTYTGFDDVALRALYSEGYVTPTLLQMFSDSTAGGQTIYGNPALDPETSRNYELGFRYDGGGVVVDAAAFYTRARDYIATLRCGGTVACPASATTSQYTYTNADAAETYGVELLAEYTVPGTAFTPYVSGAWTRRKLAFPQYSTFASNTPALSGRLGLRYDGELAGYPVWGDVYVRAGSGVRLASWDSSTATLDVESLPSWTTLNLAFGSSFGEDDRVSVAVHLNNILNQEYRSSFDELPGTGRSIEVSARIRF